MIKPETVTEVETLLQEFAAVAEDYRPIIIIMALNSYSCQMVEAVFGEDKAEALAQAWVAAVATEH
jgi:hypothetical protein